MCFIFVINSEHFNLPNRVNFAIFLLIFTLYKFCKLQDFESIRIKENGFTGRWAESLAARSRMQQFSPRPCCAGIARRLHAQASALALARRARRRHSRDAASAAPAVLDSGQGGAPAQRWGDECHKGETRRGPHRHPSR
jgi:hypothetical protein